MATVVYELQKRVTPSLRWRHIGYFRTKREALQEQGMPFGYRSEAEWKVTEHQALFDPDQPDRAFLMTTKNVPLGRTAFFV